MKPLTLDDVLDAGPYEALRPALRDAIIAHKRERRVAVGDRVTLVFEDRETVRWQVQEMLRVERIQSPEAIQQELDVYNELLPGDAELSATLFIEITELADIKPALDRLVGIDEHVALVVGADADADAEVFPARFDANQMEEDRIAAVHYVRFRLADAAAALADRLRDPEVPVRLRVSHPHYRAETTLAPETRRSLALDLEGGGPPLVDPSRVARARPAPEEFLVIEETRTLRVLRPVRPAAPGHVVLEVRDPTTGFLGAEPDLLAELFGLARRWAERITAERGSCRLRLDAETRPLRLHLAATDS